MIGAAFKVGGIAMLVGAIVYGVYKVGEIFSAASTFFPAGG